MESADASDSGRATIGAENGQLSSIHASPLGLICKILAAIAISGLRRSGAIFP